MDPALATLLVNTVYQVFWDHVPVVSSILLYRSSQDKVFFFRPWDMLRALARYQVLLLILEKPIVALDHRLVHKFANSEPRLAELVYVADEFCVLGGNTNLD